MITGLPDGEIDGLELETPCEVMHLVTQLAKLVEYMPFQLCCGHSDGSELENVHYYVPSQQRPIIEKCTRTSPAHAWLLNGSTVLSSLIVH
jgi:hypothetical protein